jgi:hypothetical protein
VEDQKPKKASIGEIGCSLAFVLLFFMTVTVVRTVWESIPAGSRCLVSQSTYGLRDLDNAFDDLEKARKVNDELGIAELAQHDAALLIPAGTYGLVIDTDFFKHFAFYRKVRVLSGPHLGMALWIRRNALQQAPRPK